MTSVGGGRAGLGPGRVVPPLRGVATPPGRGGAPSPGVCDLTREGWCPLTGGSKPHLTGVVPPHRGFETPPDRGGAPSPGVRDPTWEGACLQPGGLRPRGTGDVPSTAGSETTRRGAPPHPRVVRNPPNRGTTPLHGGSARVAPGQRAVQIADIRHLLRLLISQGARLPPPEVAPSGSRFITSPEAQEHPAEDRKTQPERSGPSARDPLWMRSRGGPVGGVTCCASTERGSRDEGPGAGGCESRKIAGCSVRVFDEVRRVTCAMTMCRILSPSRRLAHAALRR